MGRTRTAFAQIILFCAVSMAPTTGNKRLWQEWHEYNFTKKPSAAILSFGSI